MTSLDRLPRRPELWKYLYKALLVEPSTLRLEQILEVRNVILDRAEELLTQSAGEEHRALSDALETLRWLEESAGRENQAA